MTNWSSLAVNGIVRYTPDLGPDVHLRPDTALTVIMCSNEPKYVDVWTNSDVIQFGKNFSRSPETHGLPRGAWTVNTILSSLVGMTGETKGIKPQLQGLSISGSLYLFPISPKGDLVHPQNSFVAALISGLTQISFIAGPCCPGNLLHRMVTFCMLLQV